MPSHAHDLGPMPDPLIEPGEPNPGGVDALDGGDHAVELTIPDLPSASNPALEDQAPDAIKQPDETDIAATTDGASEPEKESPA